MNESSIYSVRPSSSRDVTQIETRTLRNRFTPTTRPIFVLSISPDFYTSDLFNFIISKKVRQTRRIYFRRVTGENREQSVSQNRPGHNFDLF